MSLFDFRKHVLKLKIQFHKNQEPTDVSTLCKQFSIDPKLVTFEVLRRLVAKAFQIASDFNLSYLSAPEGSVQSYIPMLSDWDVDAAVFSASNSILHLKVDLRPPETGLEEWDIIVPADVPSFHRVLSSTGLKHPVSILSQLSLQVEKTMNAMQRMIFETIPVVKPIEQSWKPVKKPMGSSEMKNFMDHNGRLTNREAFRRSVYLGGMKSSLRKVGWQLLLHICPDVYTSQERESYLARQTKRYLLMKRAWKEAYANGRLTPRQVNLIAGISVDVVRTDPTHSMFSSENLAKSKVCELFDLMVTYSLYHPSVGYCQGMSDLASPCLLTQGGDEGAAYVCFCALMRRLKSNFTPDGEALVTKLQHLHDMVVYHDPELAAHLRECGLGNMYFAHRWLLVELKREFRLEDSLRFLEVQWASLPNENVSNECEWLRRNSRQAIHENNNNLLVDPNLFHFISSSSSNSSLNDDSTSAHDSRDEEVSLLDKDEEMKVRELWQSVSASTNSTVPSNSHVTNGYHNSNGRRFDRSKVVDCFAGYDLMLMNSLIGKEYEVRERELGRKAALSVESLSEESNNSFDHSDLLESSKTSGASPLCDSGMTIVSESITTSIPSVSITTSSELTLKSNGIHSDAAQTTATKSYGLIVMKDGVVELPTPSDLGYGNPFLQYLCLSILLEYRETIFRNVKEAFDFSQFFRQVHHKHNAVRVLGRARNLYEEYLHDQNTRRKLLDDFPELEVSL